MLKFASVVSVNRKMMSEYKDGQKMIIFLSDCCLEKMIPVAYGNNLACNRCKKSERNWSEYVTCFFYGWPKKTEEGTVKIDGPITDSRFIVLKEEYEGELSGIKIWG